MHVDEYTLLEKDGVQFGVGSTKSGLGVVLYASKEKGDVSSFLIKFQNFFIRFPPLLDFDLQMPLLKRVL